MSYVVLFLMSYLISYLGSASYALLHYWNQLMVKDLLNALDSHIVLPGNCCWGELFSKAFCMQAGPMMPPADTTGNASGPKFPSRDGSETRAGEDFFGNLSGVEGGAVNDQEASSSSPALNESAGESDCVHV